MTNITIKRASIEGIDQLSVLFNDYRVFYKKEPDLNAAKQFMMERLQNDDSVIFVAENSHRKTVGFVQLYPLYSSTRMKKLWLLNDLYVDVNYRGLGISKLLLDQAKKHCIKTKACAILLESEKTNTIANKLYVASGFKKDTSHNFYEWDTRV